MNKNKRPIQNMAEGLEQRVLKRKKMAEKYLKNTHNL